MDENLQLSKTLEPGLSDPLIGRQERPVSKKQNKEKFSISESLSMDTTNVHDTESSSSETVKSLDIDTSRPLSRDITRVKVKI